MNDPADAPATPTVTRALSSTTSLYVTWTRSADGTGEGGEILGYELEMDDGQGGDYEVVLDGTGQKLLNYYLATGLTTGYTYKFRVRAYTFNGPGEWSTVAEIMVCSAPSDFAIPTVTNVTQTDISIEWTPPTDDGSCEDSITGYQVYVDDGERGDFIEANSDSDTDVRDKPNLTTLTITRVDSDNIGDRHRIKVIAFNKLSSVESPIVSTILANVPDQPPVPTFVNASSDDTQITISLADFVDSMNGGSTITSFEIQVAITKTGAFSTIEGSDTPYTAYSYSYQTSVETGETYRFRYRAWNALGSGYWSSELEVLATTVPSAPPRPVLDSVDSTTIEITLNPVEDDGGANVLDYELWYAEGQTNNNFAIFTDYEYSTDGFSASIDVTTSSLNIGSFYV